MYSLKRKDDYRLQLSRTLKQPGRYGVELYLFTPHETSFSSWTLSEAQFYFGSVTHRYGLLGQPSKDRARRDDDAFSLLSPHYEIMYGSWLFQYKASMDRLRQQLQATGIASAEPIIRALRLSQTFAQRLRQSSPQADRQQRYFRRMDIYFSWYAEQFLLECMTLEKYDELDAELKEAVEAFLLVEYRLRKERDYLDDFRGSPTRVWNRMSLHQRLLEYPVLLRLNIAELGEGTRKLVKAGSTMLIMSLFTYLLFNARGASQLSLTVLLGIALIYAIRDFLRDDMISIATRWLRKGRPRWKIRLLMPYTKQLLAQQLIWLNYRKLGELPDEVAGHSGKWATSEERQIICYRSLLNLDKAALEQNEIQEQLSLDCEQLCNMIQAPQHRVFMTKDEQDRFANIEAHVIEKQHDYNLLLVCNDPGQPHSVAQRWRIRLGANGIVQCESKKLDWPAVEKGARGWRQRGGSRW
jgi:hypothetical protein